jgi:hypothetical protein
MPTHISYKDAVIKINVATRALHRLLGCFFGGLAGLAVRTLSLGEFRSGSWH